MSPEFPTDRAPSPLRNAFDSPDLNRRHNSRLFTTIAGRYDLITRLLSFGQDQRWKARLIDLASVQPGERVVDLACGTGDLAFRAARAGGSVVGLDLTTRMIELARIRERSEAGIRINWMAGDMTRLPVATSSVSLVTTGYGLRNVPDLPAALGEIHRALRPGGRLCALDFDRPDAAWLRSIYLAHLHLVGSALGWILHGDPETYQYIPASIRRYPGAREVAAMMGRAGFSDVRHIRLMGGLMAIHLAHR